MKNSFELKKIALASSISLESRQAALHSVFSFLEKEAANGKFSTICYVDPVHKRFIIDTLVSLYYTVIHETKENTIEIKWNRD